MSISAVCDDIAIMQSHIYIRPEEAVKQWSSVECGDYQIVLVLIVGFLSNAIPPFSRTHLSIKDKPEHQAVLDVVRNSNLSLILVYDDSGKCIKYRESISNVTKEVIAKYIDARSIVIAD